MRLRRGAVALPKRLAVAMPARSERGDFVHVAPVSSRMAGLLKRQGELPLASVPLLILAGAAAIVGVAKGHNQWRAPAADCRACQANLTCLPRYVALSPIPISSIEHEPAKWSSYQLSTLLGRMEQARSSRILDGSRSVAVSTLVIAIEAGTKKHSPTKIAVAVTTLCVQTMRKGAIKAATLKISTALAQMDRRESTKSAMTIFDKNRQV
ncbi:hypothetical protein KC361_g276 [Hortaea werneckii]|nr:hypothetical protein KC361_g276 [Hortaea werneckii]